MTSPEDNRPDPDLLLHQIKREQESQTKAKMKIFFGMSAGVGKTYDMLKAAHDTKAHGIDMVVGVVETHGRRETEALLEGLTILPGKRIEYKGTQLMEMDLDAVLARKPKLVLVDELAHTNAPGSRHTKRYKDVEELLDSGIDVADNGPGLPPDALEKVFDKFFRVLGSRTGGTGLGLSIVLHLELPDADGKLNYGAEVIFEGFCSTEVVPSINVAGDYQFVLHPAYNRDRGPVHVLAVRVHTEI